MESSSASNHLSSGTNEKAAMAYDQPFIRPWPSPNASAELYEFPWINQCVLSFDGGGIRGYSSLIILRRLMEHVETIEKEQQAQSSYSPLEHIPCIDNSRNREECSDNCCKFLPCHYFDYIGGTSTGGLISIMLSRLRMSVGACIREYESLSKDIFSHPRKMCIRGPIFWPKDKYDGKRIEKAVQDVVSRRMAVSQREVGAGNFNSPPGLCRTIVFAYAEKIRDELDDYPTVDGKNPSDCVDMESAMPYAFRSYDHWGSNKDDVGELNPGTAHSIPIWQVARATTAAPTYFDPIEISNRIFGDGGFGTNNPSQRMLWEVVQMSGNDHKYVKLLLSIGTGQTDIKRIKRGNFRKYLAYAKAARMLASDSEQTHQGLKSAAKQWKIPYYRFNVPLKDGLGKIKLDEYRDDTFQRIREMTERYCKTKDKDLARVARILVENRHARKDRSLWQLKATGKRYRCTQEYCTRCQELLLRKEDLEDHLEQQHPFLSPAQKDLFVRQGTLPPEPLGEDSEYSDAESGSRI